MEADFNKGMQRFSTVVKKQGETPWSCDLAIERLLAIQFDVQEAEEIGLFVPLPESEPKVSKDQSRIKTIRNRLFILGYLEKDSGRGNLDATLKKAIRKFQKEAGLMEDGWVGEKETWPALQELVSFETPINLRRWFDHEIPKPALRRAIALRLFVLGLKEEKPASHDENIEAGLRSFGRIWRKLNPEETRSEPGLNLEWLGILFDMDGITKGLSSVSAELSKKDLEQVHSLILNAAKIELWLMGYPVRPGGYDLQKPEGPQTDSDGLTGFDIARYSKTVTHIFTVKKNLKFYKALHQFWIDHGRDDDSADELSVHFLQKFQIFFKIASEGLQTEKALILTDREEEIEKFILNKKEQIPSVWLEVRQIGARIWDGIRRVWGWFKRMVTVFKQKILKIGKNISRIIYEFALDSFTVVANVLKSVGTTMETIVSPILPGSHTEQVIFYRDLDFDPRVLILSTADGHDVLKCCQTLKHNTRLFAFGCRVLGAFISLLIDVYRIAWTAYYGLVLALIKLRRLRSEFKSLAEEYRAIFSATA